MTNNHRGIKIEDAPNLGTPMISINHKRNRLPWWQWLLILLAAWFSWRNIKRLWRKLVNFVR